MTNTKVSGHIIAAGHVIEISPDTTVASTVILMGEDVTVDGKVGGDAVLRGHKITINGEVDGNVDAVANEVRLGPHAVVGGNIKHRSAAFVVGTGARPSRGRLRPSRSKTG